MNAQMCRNDALLQGLVEGGLAAAETKAVKAHVASCPACQAAVKEYKQLMWDLSHPAEVELPPELERSYEALMEAWEKERRSTSRAKGSGWLVPAWAVESVAWTRKLPLVGAAGSLARRFAGALIDRSLPLWVRRKGGGRH